VRALPRENEEIEKNRAMAVSNAAKVRALLDEKQTDEAMTAFQIYQSNLQRFLDRSAYETLKSTVETAFSQEQGGRSRAAQQAQTIEQLLNQERAPDAFAELQRTRDELRRYLDRQDWRSLEKRVGQAYGDFLRMQGQANGAASEIRGLIVGKNAEDAYLLFEKKQPDLDRYLPKEAYEALRKEVSAAYDAVQDKKKLGASCQRDILSLIRAGKEPAAYARFTENRSLLIGYLNGTTFASLESEVERANKAFSVRQAGARSTISRIDSLIDNARVQDAHALFEGTKDKVRRDAADDRRFLELKDRVAKAYDGLREKQKQAQQTSKKIEYLMDRHEGRKANILFKQEAPRLREQLGPTAFGQLESAVARARADYESKSAAARSAMAAIEVRLDQKKVDQASAAYRKAQDDIDFYWAGDPAVEALEKRVNDAVAALRERKQWASSVVRQVRELIEKKKGKAAYAQFEAARAEIAGYMDAATLSSLDTSVQRANRQYAAAQSRADQAAGNIRMLISRERVEDAYAAFDTLESELRLYLDPSVFSSLQTIVEKFNSALQDKKHEALRISSDINRLIEKDRGDTAYALFCRQDVFLAAYLSAPMYATVKSRAARAKTDFEQNCKLAQALSDKLQAKAQRDDRVLAAHDEFDDKRDYLKQYLVNWQFARLETALRVPYDAFMQKRKQAQAVVSVLNRMIRQNQVVEARSEFLRCDRDLGCYLPGGEYKEISAKVSRAYDGSVKGRKEAKITVDKIRRLLAEDNVSEAYRMFQDSRSALELYVSDADFIRLKTEVTDAFDEQDKKVKQVKEYAKKLKQLVAKNKLWDAYKGFKLNHTALSEYLDAQSYAELESTVVGTYDKAREKARSRR
jgi:hypothetical protein